MALRRQHIAFLLLLALGAVYRLYFVSLAYSDILWDVQSYGNIAKEMLADPLYVDCCQKGGGYPLFLSVLYRVFGADNYGAVRMANIVLDLSAAFFLFAIAKSVFSKTVAWIVFVLYLFHPLAVSYVGFQLPESLTIFLLTALGFVLSRPSFARRPGLWVWTGILLGLLLWVRLSFYFFVFIILFGLALFVFRKWGRAMFIGLALMGFALASVHSLIAYQTKFQRISLVPPYTMGFETALYMSFFMGRYPELLVQYDSLNKTYYDINLEYNTTHYVFNEVFRDKYSPLFWEKIKKDWPEFFGNTARNIVWMWDTNHLFVYQDPWYPHDTWWLRLLTLTGLAGFFAGIARFIRKKKKVAWRDPVFLFTVGLFGYVIVFFAPITNETRYIVPLMPLVLLWAGYGIERIIN